MVQPFSAAMRGGIGLAFDGHFVQVAAAQEIQRRAGQRLHADFIVIVAALLLGVVRGGRGVV